MAAIKKDALWDAGYDESVEVNQRALIDKVLARYSGEFTVFRELLQNSDDAGSKAVEIRFETKEYIDRSYSSEDLDDEASTAQEDDLPDLKTVPVHRWTFRNNGMLFRDEDWSRLKKIAEGNPDEQKIGAFGVGFYSLFSVTDEPFVTSGGKWMGFYWKDGKDQLFARRGDLPNAADDPWTTFQMDLREDAPIPVAFNFTRFLASSITFMTHLRQVSVYFDDKRLVLLNKDAGLPTQIPISQGLIPTSKTGVMNIKELKSTPLNITAEVMDHVYSARIGMSQQNPEIESQPPFFSGLGPSSLQLESSPISPRSDVKEAGYLKVAQFSVVLTIFTVEVNVDTGEKLSAELHRSMRKNPPRTLKCELVYTGKEDYYASKKEDEAQPKATGSIFQGLRADLDGSGFARIFIGHATAQTTGIGGHMATRFIPTVERESIDLVDRNVAIWNKELLFVGGFLARAAYELEMQTATERWDVFVTSKNPDEPLDPELRKWFYSKARHILQFFTFHPSTPSAVVSSEMRSAFFSCVAQERPFPIISTSGIKSALDVRMPDPTFATFLKELPVFPEELLDSSKLMVAALRERGMLKDIAFTDVLKELRERPLSEEEMIACLQWWMKTPHKNSAGIADIRREFLDAAVLTIGSPGAGNERTIPLKEIQTFLNRQNIAIPTDGPLPNHLLPLSISRKFDPAQLKSLQWKEFTVLAWVQYIADPAVYAQRGEFNITESPAWADRVLQTLGKYWHNMSQTTQASTVDLLDELTCIPTTAGMKTPCETYFTKAEIFRDLAIIDLPSGVPIKGNLEKLLAELGVRKHVDLQIIYNRMIKTGQWTNQELVKYLISARITLSQTEVDDLRAYPAFSEEDRNEDGTSNEVTRVKASDLYEPLDVFKALGLPIIDWPGRDNKPRWRHNSEEARFLFNLGLKQYPPTDVILGIAARGGSRGPVAFNYFLDSYTQWYTTFAVNNHADIAFVPAIHKGEKKLVKPLEVFSGSDWQLLGFSVLDPALVRRNEVIGRLRIKAHPSAEDLLRLLGVSPPTAEDQARQWFGILSHRLPDFSRYQILKLGAMCIVPVPDNSPESTGHQLLSPNQCYFRGKSCSNNFLKACGTRDEPSVEEIALVLLKDPQLFFHLVGGQKDYLMELRKMAINAQALSSPTIVKLKKAPILIGFRRVQKQEPEAPVGGSEEDWYLEHNLLASSGVAIVDDTIILQHFGEAIFCAPQEDTLETFYKSLGCKPLSSIVQEKYLTTKEIHGHHLTQEVRSLILQRLPLFLHEHTKPTTQVSYTWLSDEKKFVIRTFEKITVMRNLSFAGVQVSKSVEASAITRKEDGSLVELCLACNTQVDMYEVATSLCRLLFDTYRVNDAFLFMTILSTDLLVLRRRGFKVDRILRQQEAEKEAAWKALVAKRAEPTPVPQLTIINIPVPGYQGPPKPLPPVVSDVGLQMPQVPITHEVKSLASIAPKMDDSILREHREITPHVSIYSGAYYVNDTPADLALAGDMEGVGWYFPKSIPNPTEILDGKRSVLIRFTNIILPIQELYQLNPTNVHIFCDFSGDIISFHHKKRIFLNLRHYEAWHDNQVMSGDCFEAYTSWYFTLAHEMAVESSAIDHKRSAYFSSICQRFLPELLKITSVGK